MADDDRKWQAFVRQRRNLLVISLVLAFVQVADLSLTELNIFGNMVAVGHPTGIVVALWVAWMYWSIRYLQYYHVMGEKYFMNTYSVRMQEFVRRIAERQIKRTGSPSLTAPPPWPHRLEVVPLSTAFVYKSKWRFILNPVLAAYPLDHDPAKHPVMEEKKDYEVTDKRSLAIAHVRAWGYVVFRTHLFSEYVLPYVVAAIPVVLFFFPSLRTIW